MPEVTRPESWHSSKSTQICFVAKLFPGRLTGSDLALRLHVLPARQQFRSRRSFWNGEAESGVGGLGAGIAGFALGRRGERKSYIGECKLFAGGVFESEGNEVGHQGRPEMLVPRRVCGSIACPPLWL